MTIKLGGTAANATQLTGIRQDLGVDIISKTLDDDVQSWVGSIIDAGGTVSGHTAAALDQFVKRGRAEGWYTLLDEVWPFAGNQMTAALQKLKYDSQAALVNVGVPTTSYAEQKGIACVTSNQYLTTGYNPVTAGRSVNDISICGVILKPGVYAGTGGYTIGTIGSSATDTPLRFDTLGAGLVSPLAGNGNTSWQPKVLGASYGSGTTHHGAIYGNSFYHSPGTAHSGDINSELEVFRCRRFSTLYYKADLIGIFCVGAYLTATQLKAMQIAMMEFERAIGRENMPVNPIVLMGDSITAGQGSTYTERWAAQIHRKKIGPVINLGSNANSLGETVATDVARTKPKLVISALGTNDNGIDTTGTGDATLINAANAKLDAIIADLVTSQSGMIICSAFYRSDKTETQCRAWAASFAEAARTGGCWFVDMDRIFREHPSVGSLMNDAIHPNQAGHDLIANAIAGAIEGIFQRGPTLDFPSVASLGSQTLTFEFLGANTIDRVEVSANALEAGLYVNAWVSSTDTVSVRVTNASAGAIDPASQVFNITLFKV